MQFVEIDQNTRPARLVTRLIWITGRWHELLVQSLNLNQWLRQALETVSIGYAIEHMVPRHVRSGAQGAGQ